jgi:hypothetical protein
LAGEWVLVRKFASEEEKKEYIRKLKAKLLHKKKLAKKYREDNRIFFFDTPPNPGPNPKQREILEAYVDPRYKVFTLTGGNRLGKTTILTIIGISTMKGKFPWNNKSLLHLFNHNKPRKVRYVGQDWKAHIESVVIPELKKWWPKSSKVRTKGNGIITDTYWYDEETGSTLEIMSNKQDPMLHEGWSGDLILYDEPPRREIRIANARGLVDRNGREFFAATLLGEPWIDREIIKATLEDGRPDPSVFNVHGEIYDNLGFGITKEGIDEFEKKLTEDEKDARLRGIPSYLSGLVYPQFSRKIHLKDRFKVPLNWLVDIAIDIHPRENQAILFTATDTWNRKWCINEIWGHGDGTWVGEEIIRCINQNSYRVNRIIIDPLAKGDKNNPNTVFDKVQEVLFRYGYALEIASKDKQSGIIQVKEYLMGPNKEPSLFFFNDLVRTLYEIEGYFWDKDTQKPADKDDHFMENLYRTILLNTKYYEPEYEEESNYDEMFDGRSAIAGY